MKYKKYPVRFPLLLWRAAATWSLLLVPISPSPIKTIVQGYQFFGESNQLPFTQCQRLQHQISWQRERHWQGDRRVGFFLVRNPRLQNNRQCFYLRKSTERTFCSFYNGHWVPIWTANRWRTSSPTVIRWTMCDVGKSMMCRSSLDKVTCGVSSTQTCLFCYFRTDLYERSQYSGLTLHLWDIPTEARFKEMNMLVQLKPDEAEHGYAWETLSDQNIVDWIKRGMALIDTIGDYA